MHEYDGHVITTPERKTGEVIPGYYSSHMYEALELLLSYGLDPNYLVDPGTHGEMNIMYCLFLIENGYVSADCLALMLDHGGDPNLIVSGERLLDSCTDHLKYGLTEMWNRYLYDAWAHYWMVLVGYGAKLSGEHEAFRPWNEHTASELKNHRDYYYGGVYSDHYSNHEPEICFFHKSTHFEIGRC